MNAVALLLLLLCIASCDARTIVVDPSDRGEAATLNAAIQRAGPGDLISILPGKYPAATVDKSLNISGAGDVVIVGSNKVLAPGCRISGLAMTASDDMPAIIIEGRDCHLSACSITAIATACRITGENFSMQDCRIDSPAGLEIFGARCAVISSSINSDVAVRINRTAGSRITGCRIAALQGVLVEESGDCRVLNNSFSGDGFAVVLKASHDNLISGNNLSGSYVSGLDAEGSRGDNFTENRISGGKVGISLRRSEESLISGNVIEKSEQAGIFLDDSARNILEDNHLTANGNGILLQGSSFNSLLSNVASFNTYGISLRGSSRNLLRDSLLHNNSYNLRLTAGESGGSSSNPLPFDQDIDGSNLADGRPVCYLVGASAVRVPSDCGFLGLVSCRDIRALDLNIANSSTGVLLVNCSNCNIQNSSVRHAESGFLLSGGQACTLGRSRAEDCQTGFLAEDSSACQIVGSRAVNCTLQGILAEGSAGLGLLGCRVEGSGAGAVLRGSRLCRIQNCSFLYSRGEGLSLSKSHNCSLLANEALFNENGISIIGSNSCYIESNNASGNERDGISLQQLELAEAVRNIASANAQGIYIQSCRLFHLQSNLLGENSRYGLRMSLSRAGNITENNVHDNGLAGANLVDCSDNLIYHNVFANNGLQNAADNGDNRWDGGSDMGGNYWSDFAASANPGVEPRPIVGGGSDRYPFRDAWGWQ